MPTSPYGKSGFAELAGSVLGSILAYLDACVSLFKLESKEASGNLIQRALLFVCAAIFLVFGHLIAITAGIALAATHFKTPWEYVALATVAAHASLGILALLIARTRFSRPLFEHTLKEIEKDRQWLQQKKTK